MNKPPRIVWLPADHRLLGNENHVMPFLVLGEKYARAVKDHVDAEPVVFPMAEASQIHVLLSMVDGVMLTGSPSNVHPSHFGESVLNISLPLDPHRDALTLELVKACLAQSVPLLGVCRGFQEINVALGGSLLQQIHEVPGMSDHREPKNEPYEVQYAPRHTVRLAAGSAFAQWAGTETTLVNSLHGQGIGRLAQGLRAIAHAPDGLIEGYEVQGASTFAYAVQWHPEWKTAENPFYKALFKAFGEACRARHADRIAII